MKPMVSRRTGQKRGDAGRKNIAKELEQKVEREDRAEVRIENKQVTRIVRRGQDRNTERLDRGRRENKKVTGIIRKIQNRNVERRIRPKK